MVGIVVVTRAALLIARRASTWTVDEHLGGLSPACVAVDPRNPAQVYCGTARAGLFRSRDSGRNWEPVGPGIDHPMITAVDVGHAEQADGFGIVYAGTEPSAVFRSDNGGDSWVDLAGLRALPSADTWSFPPRPQTHHPWRFAWRLNNEESVSELSLGKKLPVSDDQIAGVLVPTSGWIDPVDWEPEDLAYVHAETMAALLAWLWSLPCPVVNRYPSAVWYRPQCPLLSWQPLLQRCGLRIPETVVTNVEHEARAFGRTTAAIAGGDCVRANSSPVRYLISSEEEWTGLASLQRLSPVCLAVPDEKIQLVCAVGERVIWNDEPSTDALQLAPALRRFAAAAGFAFVELALAPTDDGVCSSWLNIVLNWSTSAPLRSRRWWRR